MWLLGILVVVMLTCATAAYTAKQRVNIVETREQAHYEAIDQRLATIEADLRTNQELLTQILRNGRAR